MSEYGLIILPPLGTCTGILLVETRLSTRNPFPVNAFNNRVPRNPRDYGFVDLITSTEPDWRASKICFC